MSHPTQQGALLNRAVCFVTRGQAQVQPETMPRGGPGTILVQTEYSGVSNGTERSFLMGGPYGQAQWPVRFAYQTVGRIIEVGKGVAGYQVGDRVFSGLLPQHHAAYHAYEVTSDGWRRDLIAKLPETIDGRDASLLGVAAVALHNVRRTRIAAGDRVCVVGAGLIGQFAAQMSQALGAQTVLVNRSHRRLEAAERCGITQVAVACDDADWQRLADPGFDVVIECSGGDVLEQIIGQPAAGNGLLRRYGRLAITAGRRQVVYAGVAAQMRQLEIHQSTHFDRRDLLDAIDLLAQRRVVATPLIWNCVAIDQAPAIYTRLAEDPQSLLGVVFRWGHSPGSGGGE